MTRSGEGTSCDEEIEQPLINEQLVVVEVQIRIDAILFENVVADRDLRKQIRLAPIDQLAVSVQQIEQLRLKSGSRTIRVEIGQEGILLIIAHERRVHASREPFGERRLSRTNGSIDRDVTKVQGPSQYNDTG